MNRWFIFPNFAIFVCLGGISFLKQYPIVYSRLVVIKAPLYFVSLKLQLVPVSEFTIPVYHKTWV